MATRRETSGKEACPEPRARPAAKASRRRRRREGRPKAPETGQRRGGGPGAGCARHRRVAHQGQDHREVPRAPGYDVKATIGHLRDLPTRELGVDVERGFEPKYVTIKGKTKTLSELKKAAKTASTIYLATDPDREGEAIAWHVADQIDSQVPVHRVLFEEITRDAVLAAMDAPRKIDERKVDAQQARRILDRLVGYKASPILWRTIKTGLSAGRVQTVALRLHRRARAGDPRLHAAGVLDHRGAVRGQGTDLRGLAGQGGRPQAAAPQRGRRPRGGGRGPEPAVRRHQGRAAPPQQAARRAVHHQHAPAGGGQEARLLLPADHARGAGPLRGHRRRRGGAGRSGDLHADRLGAGGGQRGRRGPRPHRRARTASPTSRRSPTPTATGRTPGCRAPTRRSGPPTCAGTPTRSSATSSPTSSASTSSSGSGSSPRR